MTGYILRRLLAVIPVLLIIASLSFFIMRVAPGGPFSKERSMTEEVRKSLEAKYHFDKPLWQQYLIYMQGLLSGDLGPSFQYEGRTVNEIVADGFGTSLELGAWAMALAVVLGLSAGIVAGWRQNSWLDHLLMSFSMTGISIPNFVMGPLLVLLFSLTLHWLPVAGWRGPRYTVLPVVALALPYTAYIARLSRAGMLEVIRTDYIRTARAKGLPERLVVLRHALRAAIMPVVSYLGPASAGILTGILVIESIFSIPGLGRYFVLSALNRDYTVVLGVMLIYSVMLVSFNLLVDLAYGVLDPRVRYDKQ